MNNLLQSLIDHHKNVCLKNYFFSFVSNFVPGVIALIRFGLSLGHPAFAGVEVVGHGVPVHDGARKDGPRIGVD